MLLSSTGSTVNPHTYVGRERYYRMANADLYHLGFRDYAQALARFMTVDPARERLNWVTYAGNRPGLLVDPTGRFFGCAVEPSENAAVCDVACGERLDEPPYWKLSPGDKSPFKPCHPCDHVDGILTRLRDCNRDIRGVLHPPSGGRPPYQYSGSDPRGMCKEAHPYACPQGVGRLAGFFFIPIGRFDACTGQCVFRHEQLHVTKGKKGYRSNDYVWTECPSFVEEMRCLLEFLLQMRTDCCGEFQRHQYEIRRLRDETTQAAAECRATGVDV